MVSSVQTTVTFHIPGNQFRHLGGEVGPRRWWDAFVHKLPDQLDLFHHSESPRLQVVHPSGVGRQTQQHCRQQEPPAGDAGGPPHPLLDPDGGLRGQVLERRRQDTVALGSAQGVDGGVHFDGGVVQAAHDDGGVERLEIIGLAQLFLSARAVIDDFGMADLVGTGLPRPAAITVNLAGNLFELGAVALDKELARLLAAPALVVQAGVDDEHVDAVRDTVVEELGRLARDGVGREEFELSVRAQRRRLVALADSPAGLMGLRLAGLMTGRATDPCRALQELDAVTPEDVAAVAAGCRLDTVYALRGRTP